MSTQVIITWISTASGDREHTVCNGVSSMGICVEEYQHSVHVMYLWIVHFPQITKDDDLLQRLT